MSLNTQPYKGARDFYPPEKNIQNYIFNIWRKAAISFGYQEYDASLIEPLELYLAKTSEEIVNDQTYVFTDRGGRNVTLRPEMTPTVSRMVAAKRQELSYPLRWFSIPNLWRYERPQRGRLREHWQLNVDLFGVDNISADHEIILLANTIMQKFGATKDMYSIRLNSRKLVNYMLSEYLGLNPETSIAVTRLIDRMHKMTSEEFSAAISDFCGDKTGQLLKILKVTNINELPDQLLNHSSVQELKYLQDLLAKSDITNANVDISLMRGFDYYTDIVFEMYDTDLSNNRSLFGGGRYDGLVGLFGVEPVPTVGFGMGDVTLKDFLESHNLLPQLKSGVDLTVICIGQVYDKSQELLNTLRGKGLNVSLDNTNRKIDKVLKNIVKNGVKYALFVGEQELNQKVYNLKNLDTGEEQRLDINAVVEKLQIV